jgi:uncharacterized OB-fold protein
VSDQRAPEPYGDPNTYAFWDAARSGRLLIQRCTACGAHQFYGRPFCLACDGEAVEWVPAAGTGTVYSVTTVHVRWYPEHEPPYQVAVVALDEGPRLTANIVGEAAAIGDRVAVAWRERDGLPPLPVFAREPA